MPRRVLALAVARVLEPQCRRRRVTARTIVPHVDPQPRRACLRALAALAAQRADGRAVAVNLVGLEHVTSYGISQQQAAVPHHVGDGRAAHLDALAAVDMA